MTGRCSLEVFGALLFLGHPDFAPAQDVAVTPPASLTDPQRLATLTTERAANPRLLKCIYWLEEVRSRGHQPVAIIMEAQTITSSAGEQAALVRAGLLRNLDIAEKLRCLTSDNLDLMRRGRSPTVTRGPYAGEPAEVDHIVPIVPAPGSSNRNHVFNS